MEEKVSQNNINTLLNKKEISKTVEEVMSYPVKSHDLLNGVEEIIHIFTNKDLVDSKRLKLYNFCLNALIEERKNIGPISWILALFSLAISLMVSLLEGYDEVKYVFIGLILILYFRVSIYVIQYYKNIYKLTLMKELVEEALEQIEPKTSQHK